MTTFPFQHGLPTAAAGAVEVVRALAAAGHQALLAGGCVRDLLLGREPEDYDVATDAGPEQITALFRPTRQVGAQFGVVLVKRQRRWVEVATFRADGPYVDGRRPTSVTRTDAAHDAQRRDFTVNGMFLDPLSHVVIDYVGGHADLAARVVRAIGEPAARFAEDHLRLLRAVRFAAKLGFPIEPVTLAAIRTHAAQLARVAPERIREELARMLAHPARRDAWQLLHTCGLLPHLWPGVEWSEVQAERVETLLGRLPREASFGLALGVLLGHLPTAQFAGAARSLTLANDERDVAAWLVAHQSELDDPEAPSLAQLKRLMAHRAFGELRALVEARYLDRPAAAARRARLAARVAGVRPEAVQPPPLVTGDDLLARHIPPGPVYKAILDELYTAQLEEQLVTRAQALHALAEILVRTRLEGSRGDRA